MTDDSLVTLSQAARSIGCSRQWLRALIRAGHLTAVGEEGVRAGYVDAEGRVMVVTGGRKAPIIVKLGDARRAVTEAHRRKLARRVVPQGATP